MERFIESIKNLTENMENLNRAIKILSKQQSEVDKRQDKLLHKIENTQFNHDKGYEYAIILKKLRAERRSIKNTLNFLTYVRRHRSGGYLYEKIT